MINDGWQAVLDWLRLLLAGTPGTRRLIYALPPGSLVESMASEIAMLLTELGLADRVALHAIGVSRAAEAESWSGPQWRRDMHLPAIVIGPSDVLVSKALNRGYGVSPNTYSIDFALTTNGARWIFDESGLCPRAVATIRQINQLSVMTGRSEVFEIFRHSVADRQPEPSGLNAGWTVGRLDVGPGDYPAIAAAAVSRHRPGTRTLIVANTVAAARQLYTALIGGGSRGVVPPGQHSEVPVPALLVHTQLRGRERAQRAAALAAEIGSQGQIVVGTAVVEVGLRLDAALVVSEAAAGLPMALRAGQCGRDGAELCWVPPVGAWPYDEESVAASVALLGELEGQLVTSEKLADLGLSSDGVGPPMAELSLAEIIDLFDTDSDVDIERHLCDGDDLEAQLVWATWEAGPDGRPPADARVPPQEWRCRAALAQVGKLAARVPVWRRDWARDGWVALNPGERAAPGEILLVAATDGGYDPVLGFDPDLTAAVPDCPSADPQAVADVVGEWVSLRQHSEETRDQVVALIDAIRPGLPPTTLRAVACAAYLHDAGKAHPIWQDALCALALEDDAERVARGRPWAKSGTNGRLEFAGDVAFKHELGSLLLLDGPLRGLVDVEADRDRDLVRYLVLAHHGRLRVQVSEPETPGPVIFGLEQGRVWRMSSGFGVPGARRRPVKLKVDLKQFDDGGSWAATVRGLLDWYGPFELAYLETLVRVADWRASGGDPLP